MRTPLGELQERIDAEEFMKYRALWFLEPYGIESLMAGEICSAIYHAFGGGQKKPGRDFIPIAKPPEQQSPEEVERKFLAALGHHG